MAIEIVTTETHGVAFIHLSDYSGNVDIVAEGGSTVTVPIAALEEFLSRNRPDWS